MKPNIKKKDNRGKKKGITIPQIKDAMEKSGGIIKDAAEMLDCSISNLCHRIAKNENLKEFVESYEKTFVKMAESNLMVGLKEGNPSYTMFYLKCKGGYSEKQKVESDVKLSYEQLLDVIKALKSE